MSPRLTLALAVATCAFIVQVQSQYPQLHVLRSPRAAYRHHKHKHTTPANDDHTTVVPPADDAHTTVIPPGDDDHTTVIPPGDDDHTTVIPPDPVDDDDGSLAPGKKPPYPADFAKYPFMAAVVNEGNDGYEFLANGVILNERWLITAAEELVDLAAPSLPKIGVVIGQGEFHSAQVSEPYRLERIVAVAGNAVMLKVSQPLNLDESAQPVSFANPPPKKFKDQILSFLTTFKNESPLLAKRLVVGPVSSSAALQPYEEDCYPMRSTDRGAPIFFWRDKEDPIDFVGIVAGTKAGNRQFVTSRSIKKALANLSQ